MRVVLYAQFIALSLESFPYIRFSAINYICICFATYVIQCTHSVSVSKCVLVLTSTVVNVPLFPLPGRIHFDFISRSILILFIHSKFYSRGIKVYCIFIHSYLFRISSQHIFAFKLVLGLYLCLCLHLHLHL